jgi:tol-pal system protein YbgF
MTRTALFVVGLLVLAPGLARAQDREQLQTNADIRMLQEQVAKLQLTANQLTALVTALSQRIDQNATADQKAAADSQLLIKDLTTNVNTIREKLDDNTVRVQQVMQEVPSLRSGLRMLADQITSLVNALQPGGTAPGTPGTSGSTAAPADGSTASAPAGGTPPDGTTTSDGASNAPATSSSVPLRLPESPTRIFEAASSDYMSNRLDNAVAGFTEFVEKFPDAPDAARAQFFIGQSYFQKGQFREAITAYEKVVTNYKDSDQVPDAYYQEGLAYQNLGPGERANAQRVFELLVKQYPNSTAAIMASQKLKAMGAVTN